jgi:septal ring factor EnvC (AmiA/AmiB activator)
MGGLAAHAHANVPNPFERLRTLDRLADHHHREARRLRALLADSNESASDDAAETRLDRTVSMRLRRQLAGDRMRWERAHRYVRRHRWQWAPGTSSDVSHLLQMAERQHLASQTSRIRALRRLDDGPDRRRLRVGNEARMTVELAQHQATEEAARTRAEWVVERARRHETATRRAIERASEQLESTLARMPTSQSRDFHRRKGGLTPPVSKKPSQRFGPRKQDDYLSYVRHTGWTYRIPPNTEVRAVASGEVVYARRLEGYGDVVILAHGRHYHTVYAHLRALDVEPGDEVEQGSVVGRSGETGSLDGPKLYFEMRREGTPIDPEPWFVRGGGE